MKLHAKVSSFIIPENWAANSEEPDQTALCIHYLPKPDKFGLSKWRIILGVTLFTGISELFLNFSSKK